MKKDENFETLYEALQGDFNKYISDIKLYLKKRDSEYKSYLDSVAKIKEKNRKIDELASGEFPDFTKSNLQDLQEIIFLHDKINQKEEKAIFYSGIGNAICLFREMESLKNSKR